MKIALIGSYRPDAQRSMILYAELLRDCLLQAGHEVELVAPRQVLPWSGAAGPGRWLGYVDKYIIGAPDLARAASRADLVHICDHSNAVYVPARSRVPYTVTCHDMLAIRGLCDGLADYRPSPAGRYLQRAILAGLKRTRGAVCVSSATVADFRRLIPDYTGPACVVPNALNFAYRPLSPAERAGAPQRDLQRVPDDVPFVLHVGSGSRNKNREMLIRTVAHLHGRWNGNVVLAGQPMSAPERRLALDLGVGGRIIEIVDPPSEQLRVLYNLALCLFFPSRWEGFGWPLIEAQACGCPVLCSDRAPMPEVTGGGAAYCPPDDVTAFAGSLIAIAQDPALRRSLIQAGLKNAERFTRDSMTKAMVGFFETVSGRGHAAAP